MPKLRCSPIGIISNSVNEPIDAYWGSVASRVNIKPEFADGIRGLDQFSHALIITFLDRAAFNPVQHLVRRPRGLDSMPEVGIFAQRAKDRPNALGVTAVKILHVGVGYFDVIGLDAINGTPVIDIKPYYPRFDLVNDAVVPEWVGRLMDNYF